MSERDTMGGGGSSGSFGSGVGSSGGFDRSEGGTFGVGSSTVTEGSGQGGQGMGGAVDQAKEMAGQAVDTARDKAGQVTEQATAKTDVGIEKAAGGLDRAADVLRERAGGTGAGGGAMQSAATMAADRLDSAAQYLQGKDTDQLVAELEALVRRRPMESLLVAAGVGFVLSKALR
jgi:hypothetical protein